MSTCLALLNSRADILREVWQFEDGALPRWKGYFNRYDGYAHSANALKAVYEACAALSVRFLLGEAGRVAELVYQNNKATDVRTTRNSSSWLRARRQRSRRAARHPGDILVERRLHVRVRGQDESTQTLPDGRRVHQHWFGWGLAPPANSRGKRVHAAQDEALHHRLRAQRGQLGPRLQDVPHRGQVDGRAPRRTRLQAVRCALAVEGQNRGRKLGRQGELAS
ncbi:hypothetical protein F5Y09DRAFT_320746 [Xylaria sp. FL1042]|nr:hypothetical protein F5Y09DRAFT_320746 [Xylaria sp. FL1042]